MPVLPISDDEVLVIARDILTGQRVEARSLGSTIDSNRMTVSGWTVAEEYRARHGVDPTHGVAQLRTITWTAALRRLADAGKLRRVNANPGYTRGRQQRQPRWRYALPDSEAT